MLKKRSKIAFFGFSILIAVSCRDAVQSADRTTAPRVQNGTPTPTPTPSATPSLPPAPTPITTARPSPRVTATPTPTTRPVAYAEVAAIITANCAGNSCHSQGGSPPLLIGSQARVDNVKVDIGEALLNGSMPKNRVLSNSDMEKLLAYCRQ